MMISVNILEDLDKIEKDDWVRQLNLIYTGQSDYLQTNATYGGMPMNRMRWIPAWAFCPAWVGKTVGEFRREMLKRDRHATEMSDYEFVRGEVPKRHKESLTAKEIKIARMIWEK